MSWPTSICQRQRGWTAVHPWLPRWTGGTPTPKGHQSTASAAYRLGGNAASGVGALIAVAMPDLARGDLVTVTVDVAISIVDPLQLTELAMVMRDALLLAGTAVPDALVQVLPPEAAVTRVELHLVADNTNGNNFSRPNDLGRRVCWDTFGPRTRDLGRSLGVAVEASGPLTSRDVAELVAGALEHMALDSGFLEPETAIASVRQLATAPAAGDLAGG